MIKYITMSLEGEDAIEKAKQVLKKDSGENRTYPVLVDREAALFTWVVFDVDLGLVRAMNDVVGRTVNDDKVHPESPESIITEKFGKALGIDPTRPPIEVAEGESPISVELCVADIDTINERLFKLIKRSRKTLDMQKELEDVLSGKESPEKIKAHKVGLGDMHFRRIRQAMNAVVGINKSFEAAGGAVRPDFQRFLQR